MSRVFVSLALLCALGLLYPAPATAVNVLTVPVGNAGNANDPATGSLYGGVANAYNIGKTEVTVGQYKAFLDSVAADDTYGLYNPSMATDDSIAGITQGGSSPNYTYSVIGSPDSPITYVSWGDAARFANWMYHGQPIGAQGAGTTEDGSYFLDGANSDAALNAVVRKPGATWVIPSENEWYKAAYHQPAVQGGDADNYWDYATRTNNEPNSDDPPVDPGIQNNAANFYRDDGLGNGYNDGYAVAGPNYLTDAGAYTQSGSFYGTFDQSGNVWEWNEALISGSARGLRGGSWFYDSSFLPSSIRGYNAPTFEYNNFGFRVATVPEPGSGVLAVLGLVAGLLSMRRGRV